MFFTSFQKRSATFSLVTLTSLATLVTLASVASSAILGATPVVAAKVAVAEVLVADVVVGQSVAASQRKSLSEISHADWDRLLKKYVDNKGMVNYTAWQASTDDSIALDRYLNLLSSSNGEGSAKEKLAYWINAYNAVTIKGILREYPTSSIRNHTATFFGYNIWKNLKLIVGDKQYSLDEMEHKVLRKMNEPRIHFAIVCASIGCPPLRSEAYLAEKLDQQLTTNAKRFFEDSSKFQYQSASQTFLASPILDWFKEDFGNSTAERLKTIAPWLPTAAAQETAAAGAGSFTFKDYDWQLNDQKR